LSELIPTLLPVLLVDVLNPVLFALLVFAAGTARPIANSVAMLAGHTLAYFCAGIVVSMGIEQFSARLAEPERIDFTLSGIVGLGLILAAVTAKKSGAPTADEPAWELKPLRCFGFGAVVNFIGIPFALPYFAAVDQIIRADLSLTESLVVLGGYNLAYALPFLVVPLATAIAGPGAKSYLERINQLIERISDILMPWMFLLLGLALAADSGTYFLTGEGLFQFGDPPSAERPETPGMTSLSITGPGSDPRCTIASLLPDHSIVLSVPCR
jgi:cytochrome c biogenesis protein CcdA